MCEVKMLHNTLHTCNCIPRVLMSSGIFTVDYIQLY